MLVDSHCHLDFPDFDEEREDVVTRARNAGVGHMVTICTRLERFERSHAIAKAYDDVSMAIGVHPLEAAAAGKMAAKDLRPFMDDPLVVGVGECGLDYHYSAESKDTQIHNFYEHIEVAQDVQMPLIIHTRDADDDTIRILSEGKAKQNFPCVIHCFTGGSYLGDACLEMGCTLSFSGIVTFKNALDIQGVAKAAPDDRILVETDSPYLAPVPKRGKRNEPAFVAHTAAFLAELRGVDVVTLHHQTGRNFFKLFNKLEAPKGLEAGQEAAA